MVNLGRHYKHHKNGLIYTPIMIVNEDSTNDKYPISVVYIGVNGKTWSKPMSNWLDTMILLDMPILP